MALTEQIQGEFRNWIRASLGLKYLKNGLVEFISSEARKQYDRHVGITIKTARVQDYKCKSCLPDTLLPCHQVRNGQCNHGNPRNCICSRRRTNSRRICPEGGACGIFYDLITDEHTHKDPCWYNTNFDQWSSVNGYFEFIKCFISTSGYKTKSNFEELDALALLSICQNNRKLNMIFQGTGFLDLFEKVIYFYVIFHNGMLCFIMPVKQISFASRFAILGKSVYLYNLCEVSIRWVSNKNLGIFTVSFKYTYFIVFPLGKTTQTWYMSPRWVTHLWWHLENVSRQLRSSIEPQSTAKRWWSKGSTYISTKSLYFILPCSLISPAATKLCTVHSNTVKIT